MTDDEEEEEEEEGTWWSLLVCDWVLGVVSLLTERGRGLELFS